jgi:hypothetical protein
MTLGRRKMVVESEPLTIFLSALSASVDDNTMATPSSIENEV